MRSAAWVPVLFALLFTLALGAADTATFAALHAEEVDPKDIQVLSISLADFQKSGGVIHNAETGELAEGTVEVEGELYLITLHEKPKHSSFLENDAASRYDVCQAFRDVGSQIAPYYLDNYGKCTSIARPSVRMSFHDCFPDECNGSILLSDECYTRPENRRLIPTCDFLRNAYKNNPVGAADLIQFAAALGTAFCHGPHLKFLPGRKDRHSAAPPGRLPSPSATKDSVLRAFGAKGFSEREIVALMGSHSAGLNGTGVPLDNSPHYLDTTFYRDTLTGNVPAFIGTDRALASSGRTRQLWKSFSKNQARWNFDFAIAMEKLGNSGYRGKPLADCSYIIPNIVSERLRQLHIH